ncbi:TIGR03915 family putative DNA repair protein [Maribacter arenosus]|uniref:TIGR03915 family putative DNA repair protein n=1 Tax=Maribacter arenosus TaxID=1854708 RepID=A0ABR7V7E7_9FLAO|nr:TIGR03915 family putative DNA repair protein [Maribacter arenosus]MBD0849619.1 TIGR03915 family putative DNA repair protein [Maribacter arenosus]
MENPRILIYDGSFNGFLTAIHIALGNDIDVVGFRKYKPNQEGLFIDNMIITTQQKKAKNVWTGIEKKSHVAIRNIYFAFLSETDGVDFMLYQHIRKLYCRLDSDEVDQAALIEAKISKLALQVNREKSYIENNVDFKTTKDSLYIGELEPGFNILPLISRHFRHKYPKHPWIIYDRKRKYGVYYNGISLELINKEIKDSYLKANMGSNPYSENNYRMAM